MAEEKNTWVQNRSEYLCFPTHTWLCSSFMNGIRIRHSSYMYISLWNILKMMLISCHSLTNGCSKSGEKLTFSFLMWGFFLHFKSNERISVEEELVLVERQNVIISFHCLAIINKMQWGRNSRRHMRCHRNISAENS